MIYIQIKVRFFNKRLVVEYFALLSIISIIFSFAVIVIEIPDNFKIPIGLLLLVFLLSLYIIMWIKANLLSEAKIKINNSTVVVKIGDIFKEDDFKVIAFNEYFDTQVDNKIIAEKTLNGIYLKELVENAVELDNLISNDAHLKDRILEHNELRACGKKIKYAASGFFMGTPNILYSS